MATWLSPNAEQAILITELQDENHTLRNEITLANQTIEKLRADGERLDQLDRWGDLPQEVWEDWSVGNPIRQAIDSAREEFK